MNTFPYGIGGHNEFCLIVNDSDKQREFEMVRVAQEFKGNDSVPQSSLVRMAHRVRNRSKVNRAVFYHGICENNVGDNGTTIKQQQETSKVKQ